MTLIPDPPDVEIILCDYCKKKFNQCNYCYSDYLTTNEGKRYHFNCLISHFVDIRIDEIKKMRDHEQTTT